MYLWIPRLTWLDPLITLEQNLEKVMMKFCTLSDILCSCKSTVEVVEPGACCHTFQFPVNIFQAMLILWNLADTFKFMSTVIAQEKHADLLWQHAKIVKSWPNLTFIKILLSWEHSSQYILYFVGQNCTRLF